MQSWLSLDVVDFTEHVYANPSYGAPDLVNSPRLLVTCHREFTLEEVMDKNALSYSHLALGDRSPPAAKSKRRLLARNCHQRRILHLISVASGSESIFIADPIPSMNAITKP
ncbi:hypothetical protein Drorol1_Dr00008140 [Drosera rotundifolia]